MQKIRRITMFSLNYIYIEILKEIINEDVHSLYIHIAMVWFKRL